MHGTYIGPRDALRGKTALLRTDETAPTRLLAQFDAVDTGYGYGWHPFPAKHFSLDKPVEKSE